MFNESVAIKVRSWNWDETEKLNRSWAKSEASVMAKLNHPGIVPLVGVSSLPDNRPCLIMELMSGDLNELIQNRPRFSLHVSVDILFQIAEAMQHTHNAGLVHQDLHLDKILFRVVEDEHLSSGGFVVVKVIGFKTATESKEGELSENLKYPSHALFMPPEVPGRYGKVKSVDVYCFGLLCNDILCGKSPSRLVRAAGERPRLPATLPPMLASLIKRCWASDPNSRPDFDRISLELRHIKTMLITGRPCSVNFP